MCCFICFPRNPTDLNSPSIGQKTVDGVRIILLSKFLDSLILLISKFLSDKY